MFCPVPPEPFLSVPETVIAPVVAELGVSPVVPNVILSTLVAGVAHVAVVPLEVNTVALAPIAKLLGTPLASPTHILPCGILGRSLVLPIHETCILPEVTVLYLTTIPTFCINLVP